MIYLQGCCFREFHPIFTRLCKLSHNIFRMIFPVFTLVCLDISAYLWCFDLLKFILYIIILYCRPSYCGESNSNSLTGESPTNLDTLKPQYIDMDSFTGGLAHILIQNESKSWTKRDRYLMLTGTTI